MNSHQRWCRMNVSHDQGDRFFRARLPVFAEIASKSQDTEVPPTGGEISRCHLFQRLCAHKAIISAYFAPHAIWAIQAASGTYWVVPGCRNSTPVTRA